MFLDQMVSVFPIQENQCKKLEIHIFRDLLIFIFMYMIDMIFFLPPYM